VIEMLPAIREWIRKAGCGSGGNRIYKKIEPLRSHGFARIPVKHDAAAMNSTVFARRTNGG
jgi:hypothetical protein